MVLLTLVIAVAAATAAIADGGQLSFGLPSSPSGVPKSLPPRGVCPTIRLVHGKVKYLQRGRLAKFRCLPGYTIIGDRFSTCTKSGWDGEPTRCVRKGCRSIKAPPNGAGMSTHGGAVVQFYCNPGYTLRGPTVTYCTNGRDWDNGLPSCIATNSQPQKFCDFESDDLCGWTHDLNHDFDWTRLSGRTPSGHINTGPTYDHTLGDDLNGHYVYIESSSRAVNDTARLLSPIYDATVGDLCFEFYYHMWGATTGQLRVYVKKTSQPWTLKATDALFWKSGEQGNEWRRGFFKTTPVDERFQIVVEGVRGNGYVSDIAVDDLQLIDNCKVYGPDYGTTSSDDDDVDLSTSSSYLETESCLNRCENDNATSSNNGNAFVISCGCVGATCWDNGTCCPDYAAICINGVTDADDDNISTQPTSTSLSTTKRFIATTVKTTTTTKKPTMFTTTKKPITITTKKPTTTTTTKKPTTITTKKPTTTTNKPTTITTKKPTTTTTKKSTSRSPNEVLDEEEDYNTVPPLPASTDEDNAIKQVYYSNRADKHAMVRSSSFLNGTPGLVIFGSIGLLLVSVTSIVCVVKRYYLICAPKKINQSGNSESQSDVRFLTSDEILDFNMMSADDDDVGS